MAHRLQLHQRYLSALAHEYEVERVEAAMRNTFLFLIVIMPVILLLSAAATAQIGFTYDVTAERVFQGAIEGAVRSVDGHVYFTIRREDGLIDVDAGAEEFFLERQLKLDTGQAVTVIGVPLVLDGHKIIVMRELRNNGHRFAVRDYDGYPLWEDDTPVQMDPELKDSGDPRC